MLKRSPFLIFLSIVTFLVAGALWFIQSRTFAGMFKQVISKYLPDDTGIDADFSEFAIKIFPPGLSLKSPKITLREKNILKMPQGSSVRAERIDFNFQPLQMFTGNIRVHELVIVGGDLHLYQDPQADGKNQKKNNPSKKPFSLKFNWDELFQIHAEAIVIQDTWARVDWIGTKNNAELQVKSLKFGQWMGKGGLGYEFSADISKFGGTILESIPILKSLERLQASAHVNALGVQIDSIQLSGKGLEAQGNGMIRGNLQSPSAGLLLDADLSAKADIGVVGEFLQSSYKPSSGTIKEIAGNAAFSGRVRGNLVKALETLRLQGEFSANDLKFRKFRADSIQASGTWTSDPDGGDIDLEKAVITASDRPRLPGVPAIGGKIQVAALKMKLASSDPISLKLALEKAHIHWLASIGITDLKPVFPLLFKVSGPIDATIFPPKGKAPFRLQSQLNLKVDQFLLDNQKISEKRNLLKIFEVPQIAIEGPLSVDGEGVRLEGLALALPRSKLRLGGGISFKNGFDLKANGETNLEDLGQIAETPIRGEGQIAVHVHGQPEKVFVDVDVDVKNASYLRLDLGDLKGRITWDDDPSHLLLRRIQAEKGSTQYGFEGVLDLGKADTISLTASVAKGNINEFLQIFHNLTKDFWWFPQALSGPVTGDIRIGGGISLKELQITGKLNGTSWDYFGERFSRVSLQGGYDRGKYYISDFRGTKRNGRMSGKISFDTDTDYFDWDFHTQQMTVSDLDRVAQLDVPIRGRVQVDSSGKGKSGAIQSESQLIVADFSVRGQAMPPSQLSLTSANGVHKLRGTAFGNQGAIDLNYDFNPTRQSQLRAEVRHLDFSPGLLLLNPRGIADPALSGHVSGSVNLSFRSGLIERSDGEITLTEYSLAKTGRRFELAEPISFKIQDGTFDLKKLSLVAIENNQSKRSEATLWLQGRQAELEGRISGDMDVSIVEFVTSSVPRASGLAKLDFTLGGNVKAPMLQGQSRVDGLTVWVQGLESAFENVAGVFQIKQNAIHVQNLEADLAGGRANAGGSILLFSDRYPLISLKSEFSGNKLRFFPFQYAKVRGTMTVSGDRIPYLVEGDFNLESALSREKVFQQKQAQGLKAAQYTPPPSARRLSDYPKFKLKIDAVADKGILVQNDLFDAEFKAKVTVVNTIEAPRLLGSAELVQGRMTFKDRVFQIQSASAVFDNPTVVNPRMNLIAKTDVNGVKVQLYVAGTMDTLKPELTSTPVMSETEILSLLALGVTSSETKRMNASDRASIESGEAASLLLHSLDFNREVESKTGLQIQLNESVNSQVGTSVFRPQSAGENTASPKIVVKKRITKNLDVSYGSTVGVGTSSQTQINAEMKVTPGLSVIGVWDNYETTDNTQEKTTSQSYGLDLKLQKRFK